MTWALKRQIFYVVIVILFFIIFGFLIVFPRFNKIPTCFDGKQNGTERGIDCGGPCVRACLSEADEVSVLWARSFLVVPGRYNAVAYLENHNRNLTVNKIKYKFRFSDKDNIYLGKREGTAFIPPGGRFAIFERGIDIGDFIPVYTTFEFTEMPLWVSVPQTKINQLQVFASDIVLENETTSPFLSAKIKNNSFFIIPRVNVIVILYDEKHNALSVSSTYLDELKAEESTMVNFTWLLPFKEKVVATEILPLYNIFEVKLK